jgi:ribosomal protein S18 acetylase RimI-like enzyme
VNSTAARIRPYQPADLDDVYRVCLLTADSGQDATALVRDPSLPGHVWAGPYVTLEPSLAFVVEDGAGVGGYVLGALDSWAFERRLQRDWWPPLRVSHPELDAGDYLSPLERWAIHDIHHSWAADDELLRKFPSHLHIDLLPRLQGRGIGTQLMERMIASLRARGSHGLHMFVSQANHRAAGFYRHLGFSQWPAADVDIFTMEIATGPE